MLLLAIDCSFGGHSVAVLDNKTITAGIHHPKIHATDRLATTIAKLMHSQHYSFDDFDGIAFGAGPGLFSGVRSACATAQGIAFVTAKKVLAVPTMDAVALANKVSKRTLIAYPAHRNHCYLGAFNSHNNLLLEPKLYSLATLPDLTGNWNLIGRKLTQLAPLISKYCHGKIDQTQNWRGSLAPAIAKLASQNWQNAVNPESVAPHYIRDKVAYSKQELALAKQ